MTFPFSPISLLTGIEGLVVVVIGYYVLGLLGSGAPLFAFYSPTSKDLEDTRVFVKRYWPRVVGLELVVFVCLRFFFFRDIPIWNWSWFAVWIMAFTYAIFWAVVRAERMHLRS